MTPTSSTTTDHEPDSNEPDSNELNPDEPNPDQSNPDQQETPVLDADLEDDEDLDEDDFDVAEVVEEPVVVATPGPRRRAVSAVVAAVVFEVLYIAGITIIAFATAGAAAVGPTLQSVFTGPFGWVPAAVFLVCALVVALPLRGARRAPRITGLVVAAIVYVGATFFVLLAAAGTSALGVFVQELGVYPFFLAAIVAREVMVWTRFGFPRVRAERVMAEPAVSAPA